MRFKFLLATLMTLAIFSSVSHAETVTDTVLRGFYQALGQYYGVPERDVIVIRDRRIPDDEIPVVLFLAKKANVQPSAIYDLRLRGDSWDDITRRFGLSPEIYYVPTRTVSGPPYGNAYGYYKNKPKNQWKTIHLEDSDVVNLVNLRFISDHYGYSPDRVIRMRSKGENFLVINEKVKQKKEMKEVHQKSKQADKEKGEKEYSKHGKQEHGNEGKHKGGKDD